MGVEEQPEPSGRADSALNRLGIIFLYIVNMHYSLWLIKAGRPVAGQEVR